MQICRDSGGVRGLTFNTSLDQSYTCGQTSGSCSSLSGSGAALTGFGAVCGSAGALLRVQSINSPCWNRNYVQPTSPASECHLVVLAVCQPVIGTADCSVAYIGSTCSERGTLHSMQRIAAAPASDTEPSQQAMAMQRRLHHIMMLRAALALQCIVSCRTACSVAYNHQVLQ
jgi:hypothetical protein